MRRSACGFPEETLSAYLDDELDGNERREAEEHLGDCPHCRELLTQLGSTSELLGSLPLRELPRGFRSELRSALLKRKADRKVRRPAWTPPRGYLAAAVILLIMLPAAAMLTHSLLGPSMMMQADFAPVEDVVESESHFFAHIDPSPHVLMSDVVPRTEVVHLMVTDVSALTERLVDVSTSAGATVSEQEYSWSPGGKLLHSSLVLRVSPEEMEGLHQRLTQLGETILYRVEDSVDDEVVPDFKMAAAESETAEAPDSPDVVLKVTLYPYELHLEEPFEDEAVVVRALETRRMPITRRVLSAVADSWLLFGAHSMAVVLWAVGHLPHLIFLLILLVLAWLLARSGRAHSS